MGDTNYYNNFNFRIRTGVNLQVVSRFLLSGGGGGGGYRTVL